MYFPPARDSQTKESTHQTLYSIFPLSHSFWVLYASAASRLESICNTSRRVPFQFDSFNLGKNFAFGVVITQRPSTQLRSAKTVQSGSCVPRWSINCRDFVYSSLDVSICTRTCPAALLLVSEHAGVHHVHVEIEGI